MKEIKALIQPHMVTKVMDALHDLPHFPGVTLGECEGQGRGLGTGGHYEATEDTMVPAKVAKLEIYCSDSQCDEIVEVIHRAAHTGNPGDGIIVVADIDKVIRVRTGRDQDQAA